MKIAIAATGLDLTATVDRWFCRCPHFLFVDTDDWSVTAEANRHVNRGQDADIESARLMVDRGVQFVLAGGCKHVAKDTLRTTGVKLITGCVGTAAEALDHFRSGELKPEATGVPGLLLAL